jgi:hypothetical protein
MSEQGTTKDQLRDAANQQWESVQRRMLSNAQSQRDDR